MSILELKNQIISRKIGAYNLYFSSKTSFIPTITVFSYYKALLNGLKRNFPNQEEIFKQIGKQEVENIKFAFGPEILKELKSLKDAPFSKKHLEAFKAFYPSYDIFQPNIDISILEIDPKNKKATYRFKNSIFLEDTENFVYHIHLICGITEGILNNTYNLPIECKIEKIEPSKKKGESYFDLSIQLKD